MKGTSNKVILVGNIGREPEARYTPSNVCITSMSLATTYKTRDAEKTEWHNLKFIGQQAEFARDYIKKGAKIYIEGRLQTDSWDHKEYPVKCYRTEIVVNQVELLSGFKEREETVDTHIAGAPNVSGAIATAASGGFEPIPEDFDDDIPF